MEKNINRLRKNAWGVALFAALLLAFPVSGALAAGHEIVIGGTLAQSGRLQGIIRPFPKLFKAWADQVNARGGIYLSKLGKSLKIRTVLYDDQSSPPTALKFYERLATVDKVDLFIGPFTSFMTNAALQATVTHGIPMFMVEANDSVMFEKANKWRATGLAPAQWEYKRVVELYARKGGVKRFALLSRDSLHENQAREGFGNWARKAGMTVVYEQSAPKGTKDFASIITAIRQTKPDVVFIEWIPPPGNIAFLKQARSLGLNPKDIVVGHMPIPVVKAMGKSGENLVGMLYSFVGDSKDYQDFLAMCRAAGFEPWQYSEAGIRFVTFKRIEAALKKAGSLDKEAIRQAMWDVDLTVFGSVRIKQNAKGYGTLHPWPIQIQGGKYVSLWPLDEGVRTHRFKSGKW